MEWPKFLRKKENDISPENKEILDLLKQLRLAEENQSVVKSESEKPSAYNNDYRNKAADEFRIQKNKNKIREISKEIMRVCGENDLEPTRFLKPEYLQDLENNRELDTDTEEKAA